MEKPLTCLFPGRFQPFHNGHATIVRTLFARYERVIVAIAQSHLSHTARDPLTSGERYEMIRAFLNSEGFLLRADLIPVTMDIHSPVAFPFMRTIMPEFHVVCVRNPVVRMLAQYWSFVIDEGVGERNVSGSLVRQLLVSGGAWKELVPPDVARGIEHVDLIDRMRQIALGEEH
jgi:nicotinamide-nucleotide adenylyltransferase